MPAYSRILLKLSGEALAGGHGQGFDPDAVDSFCRQIADVQASGVQIGIVNGGGNIFRGLPAAAGGLDRITGDHMGMLATVINGLLLREALDKHGVPVRLMSALSITGVVDPFLANQAISHLRKGRVVIFSGGTGNPYFSTDTAAALRAAQIKADVIVKGTKVDGVYDGDPMKDPGAHRFETITFSEVLERGLKVMDSTAVAMCRDNVIPIIVFNMTREGTLLRVVSGEPVGTIVKEEKDG